jgi:hypothetical protein
MTYQLPDTFSTPDDTRALGYLRRYFGLDGGKAYIGSHFDGWGGSQDPDRFTADDLIAVSFLSVFVPPMAARRLLETEADRFGALLQAVGADRDLLTESDTIDKEWPGRQLNAALDELPGIGPTIASKLCARKRPRLIPVFDSVVAQVTNAWDSQWEPLRLALRGRDCELHDRLVRLRDHAGLSSMVSVLRVYDVVTWMEGKDKDYRPTVPEELLGAELAALTDVEDDDSAPTS